MEIKYMKRAIELAKKGIGYVNPNPLVGAVIVKNNKIIGQGYHKYFGGNHAEVEAFNSCKENVKGSTMYVTLEPCSHYGKTPPCAERIVKEGISKVIIGMKDPNPIVAGKGIKILKDAGIDVVVGALESEIKILNEIFIKYITEKIPFCVMKTASTLDGKIASSTGDSKWISCDESRKYVHQLRHKYSGIMVGIGTVLKDNPSLNTRLEEEEGKDPIRIVVDSKARIPLSSKILNIESDKKTIIVTTSKAARSKIQALKRRGAKVIITPSKNHRVDLKYLMNKLGSMGIDSILLEGGGTLNFNCLKENFVDKVVSFIAPKIIGGTSSKTSVEGEGINLMSECIKLKNIESSKYYDDILIQGYVRKE